MVGFWSLLRKWNYKQWGPRCRSGCHLTQPAARRLSGQMFHRFWDWDGWCFAKSWAKKNSEAPSTPAKQPRMKTTTPGISTLSYPFWWTKRQKKQNPLQKQDDLTTHEKCLKICRGCSRCSWKLWNLAESPESNTAHGPNTPPKKIRMHSQT